MEGNGSGVELLCIWITLVAQRVATKYVKIMCPHSNAQVEQERE